jgi:hypothetical protein
MFLIELNIRLSRRPLVLGPVRYVESKIEVMVTLIVCWHSCWITDRFPSSLSFIPRTAPQKVRIR